MNIGVLGAGQLGRMLAQAGGPMGFTFRFLSPESESCVSGLGEHLVGDMCDSSLLQRFAAGLDAVTFEWENVPLAAVDRLAQLLPVRPSSQSLACAQDRVLEKQFLNGCGLRVQAFAPIDGPQDFRVALEAVALPAMLKTRRMGYDGKGQAKVCKPHELELAWNALGSVPAIFERWIPFESEISILGVRGEDAHGNEDIRLWKPCKNFHQHGILQKTVSPASGVDEVVLHQAEQGVRTVLSRLRHEGVLCVEFFLEQGQLIANEMAPRVHNSGHWTIEGACTSQFQNHLLAVARRPLGSTDSPCVSVMCNLIGEVHNPRAALPPEVSLHLYGKSPRAGRKLGHLTSVAQRESVALERASEALAALVNQPASARG